MLESDPEFAGILILNKDLSEHRRTNSGREVRDSKRMVSSNIGDDSDSETSCEDDELSSSGDEISVASRSLASTLGESSSDEEGVEKVTCPYVEN